VERHDRALLIDYLCASANQGLVTDQCVNSTSTAAYNKMTTGTLAYTAKGVNRSLASGEGYDARTTRLVTRSGIERRISRPSQPSTPDEYCR
jgi:hypothetical protein